MALAMTFIESLLALRTIGFFKMQRGPPLVKLLLTSIAVPYIKLELSAVSNCLSVRSAMILMQLISLACLSPPV